MERFDVDGRYTWLGLGCRPEYRGSSFEQQRLPGRDLVRMDIELLRQFGQRLLALDGGQSHLGLESRAVIPARSSRHRLSCSRAILAAVRQKLHLSTCPNLPSQLSVPSARHAAADGVAAQAQADGGDGDARGRKAQARGPGRGGRRLPWWPALGWQARPWGRRQDAV